MRYKSTPFKEKIIDEFCSDLYRVMGATLEDFRIMCAKHGEIFDVACEEVLQSEGPAGLRYYLKHRVARLDYIFKRCDEEGEDWLGEDCEEDFWEYAATLNLGIDQNGLISENNEVKAATSIHHKSV